LLRDGTIVPASGLQCHVDSWAPEKRMLGWFQKLLPREEKFFEMFIRHSETVVAGAEALRTLLDGGESVPQHYKTVMDREQDADNITRDVLIMVRRTFITPFDRSDITDLITAMDNTIDQMQKTAKGVMLFDIREFTPCQRAMGDAIVKCAGLVREAMPRLRAINTEATRLSEISREISDLEGKADDLHDQGLRQLFLEHATPMAFITGNDVYDHLEKVVDRFDDVANRISGVVIDHV
jgi:predicted phosphate transport protein (TIGR00153 family)